MLRACRWLEQNGFSTMGGVIAAGYDSLEEQEIASKWVNDNAAEIYTAYRKLIFGFEEEYVKDLGRGNL